MHSWKTLEAFEAELLEDRDFRREHEALAPEYQIARTILATRQAIGMSQAALAKAVGTTQTRISKWERGQELPRLDALQRVAEATGYELHIDLVPHAGGTSRTRTASTRKVAKSKSSRRTAATKSGGRKTTSTKKSAARRSTSRRKTAARKSTGRKAALRKSTGRKATVKRSSARRK